MLDTGIVTLSELLLLEFMLHGPPLLGNTFLVGDCVTSRLLLVSVDVEHNYRFYYDFHNLLGGVLHHLVLPSRDGVVRDRILWWGCTSNVTFLGIPHVVRQRLG